MRALVAIGAGANAAVDANLRHPRGRDREAFSITNLGGKAYGAANGHGQTVVLGVTLPSRAINSARKDEELTAVRHFHKLRHDAARGTKTGVHIKARASAAVFGKLAGGSAGAYAKSL